MNIGAKIRKKQKNYIMSQKDYRNGGRREGIEEPQGSQRCNLHKSKD